MVVCGDVFESNQLAPRVISQALEVMRGVGVDVYLLPATMIRWTPRRCTPVNCS